MGMPQGASVTRSCLPSRLHNWYGRGGPEPIVAYKTNYVPHDITISHAGRLVWNCTDTIPSTEFELSNEFGAQKQTYAACARALLAAIQDRKAVAA